jgi:glycosyltransferase involved in cell wall biosynthesis
MQSKTRKRILMLLENNTYTEDVRVRQEAQALLAADFRVTVICPGKPFHDVVNGVSVYRFPNPPNGNGVIGYLVEYGYSMLAVFALSLFVLLWQGFDVIHAHNPPDTFALIGLFYKFFGKRFVFDQHDLSPELFAYARFSDNNSTLIYKLLVWFESFSYRVANRVIVTNESYRKISIERSGVNATKVSIVRNGPDLSQFPCMPPVEHERQDDIIQIAYMGVIGYQDGVDNLIRALYHLKTDFQKENFRCVIMGRGLALDLATSLVKELNLQEYVSFVGWMRQPQIAEIMKTVDICVAPEPSNRYNDFSTIIKLMEYMAYCKPVVAFDLPEHRVTAGNSVLYARTNDCRDFAAQIAHLTEDSELRRELGERGRQRIEGMYAWQYQAEALVNAYEQLLGSP